MNQAQYHSKDCLELLSACGSGDLRNWRIDSSIARIYDKSVKSYVYVLEGSSAKPKISAPLPQKKTLALKQHTLLLQVNIPTNREFSMQISQSKRTLTFGTFFKKLEVRSEIAKIPMHLKRDTWYNAIFPIAELVPQFWSGKSVSTVSSISICASCKLQRVVATQRDVELIRNDATRMSKFQPSGALNLEIRGRIAMRTPTTNSMHSQNSRTEIIHRSSSERVLNPMQSNEHVQNLSTAGSLRGRRSVRSPIQRKSNAATKAEPLIDSMENPRPVVIPISRKENRRIINQHGIASPSSSFSVEEILSIRLQKLFIDQMSTDESSADEAADHIDMEPTTSKGNMAVLPHPTTDHYGNMQSWEKDLLNSMMRSNNQDDSWQSGKIAKHHYAQKHNYEDEKSESEEDSGFHSRPISAEMTFSRNANSSSHYLLTARQRIQSYNTSNKTEQLYNEADFPSDLQYDRLLQCYYNSDFSQYFVPK